MSYPNRRGPNPQATSAYKTAQVTSASRGQVLILLYEAAIQHCKKAQTAIEAKDLVAKGTHIGKVHDIVNELATTLDHKIGGAIAQDLERLYNFMIEQLIQANSQNAVAPIAAVQKLLETLLDAWRVAVEKAKSELVGQK